LPGPQISGGGRAIGCLREGDSEGEPHPGGLVRYFFRAGTHFLFIFGIKFFSRDPTHGQKGGGGIRGPLGAGALGQAVNFFHYFWSAPVGRFSHQGGGGGGGARGGHRPGGGGGGAVGCWGRVKNRFFFSGKGRQNFPIPNNCETLNNFKSPRGLGKNLTLCLF